MVAEQGAIDRGEDRYMLYRQAIGQQSWTTLL